MIKKILASGLILCGLSVAHAQQIKIPEIGIAQSLNNDNLIDSLGYHYLVESISKLVSPKNISDDQFLQNLQAFKKLKSAIYAFNLFIPGDLKLVGPDVNEEAILSYAEIVFKRCDQAGVHLIVWGSGGARRVPDGFDKKEATAQFIAIGRKVAGLAKKYKVTLALENLNSGETNFINTMKEALDVVKKVNHPNFRLCADIYHMLKEGESPAIIISSGPYLVHCDIAEKENRTPPGTNAENFIPYLTALKKVNYKGKIILECQWKNLADQGKPALIYLQQQLAEAYK